MGIDSEFNKIYIEYHPKVLHYVSRLTGNREAEDITQEVFEKVNRGLSGLNLKTLRRNMTSSSGLCLKRSTN